MSTQTEPQKSSNGSVWKIVLIVVAVLIAVSIIGPILKAAFWLALIGLAVVGAYAIFVGNRKS